MSIKLLTLSNRDPLTLKVSVVDENNKNAQIPGTLTNLQVVPADPAQDSGKPNDADPNNAIDVEAVASDGGTSVNVTGDFISTDLKPDQTPVINGPVTGTLTLLNDIVVKAALAFDPA